MKVLDIDSIRGLFRSIGVPYPDKVAYKWNGWSPISGFYLSRLTTLMALCALHPESYKYGKRVVMDPERPDKIFYQYLSETEWTNLHLELGDEIQDLIKKAEERNEHRKNAVQKRGQRVSVIKGNTQRPVYKG